MVFKMSVVVFIESVSLYNGVKVYQLKITFCSRMVFCGIQNVNCYFQDNVSLCDW